ncbi:MULTISPECIES: prepilin peptidase [Streptococcus]|uniref:Prepilin peptidase n=1 Tax=Streptococcus caledonicus TaxID=2614158 RepID=A0ABW0UBG7_9STRE|nr:prepilin peptidase [Streptococcus sp. S784/96/1]
MEIFFYFYTLTLGFILSYYDLKNQEYPLIIWLLSTLLLLPFYTANLTFTLLCLLGIFALLKNINVGAGDFLYLATLGLAIPLSDLLWIVQFASILGIFFYLFKLNKQKTIAFIPLIVMGYALVLVGKETGLL